jgi:transcriptional regulator with XRE-family HTH domain
MKQPDFGKELTRIRNLKGITQEELASKSNVTIRTIQRIESGIVNPRSYTVKSIGEILGYDFLSVESLREESNGSMENEFDGLSNDFAPKVQKTTKNITMVRVFLTACLLIIAISLDIIVQSTSKPKNTKKHNGNVVVVYGSQLNTPTINYRFKDAKFKPLIKQHKHRIIHDISNHWVNTNIKLEPEKTYFIMVHGLASTSSNKLSLWIGPDGKDHLHEGLPMYSVIGRIGNGLPFVLGTHTEVYPGQNETFYLGYNDDNFGDNIGYYIVDIFEGTELEILNKLKENDIEIGKYYDE